MTTFQGDSGEDDDKTIEADADGSELAIGDDDDGSCVADTATGMGEVDDDDREDIILSTADNDSCEEEIESMLPLDWGRRRSRWAVQVLESSEAVKERARREEGLTPDLWPTAVSSFRKVLSATPITLLQEVPIHLAVLRARPTSAPLLPNPPFPLHRESSDRRALLCSSPPKTRVCSPC